MGIREQDVNKWSRSVKSYFRDFIKKAENNNVLALVGPGNYVDQKVSIYKISYFSLDFVDIEIMPSHF